MTLKTQSLTLPSLNFHLDTTELEAAISDLLPDQSFLESMLTTHRFQKQLQVVVDQAEEIPKRLIGIAENTEEALEEAWQTCLESIEGLLARLSELPEEFESAISEQLEDSAESILEAFEHDIKDNWEQLPEMAADQMQQALTNGFENFINVAEQAEEYFRTEIYNTLQESREHLTGHVEKALDSGTEEVKVAAIDSLKRELITSEVVMLVGSSVTSALSPLLPYIKAAHLTAKEINELLEMMGA